MHFQEKQDSLTCFFATFEDIDGIKASYVEHLLQLRVVHSQVHLCPPMPNGPCRVASCLKIGNENADNIRSTKSMTWCQAISTLQKPVCVCAFIFIPWLNSVKYRKCHKMSISQVHLFQKSSCTYKFVYIYIYISWKYTLGTGISILPPGPQFSLARPPPPHLLFQVVGTPKYVYAKLKRLLRYKPTSLVLVWMAALRFLPPPSHKRVPSDPLEVKPSRCRWQLVNRFSPTKNACGNTSDDCWCSKTGDVNFDFVFFSDFCSSGIPNSLKHDHFILHCKLSKYFLIQLRMNYFYCQSFRDCHYGPCQTLHSSRFRGCGTMARPPAPVVDFQLHHVAIVNK